MSNGNFMIFLNRPISLGILIFVFVLVLLSVFTLFKKWKVEYKSFREKE
jgi:TctA family transporter